MAYACRRLVVVLDALHLLKWRTFYARLFLNYTNEIATEL